MFDPNKFSDDSINQFKTEGWEDNRFRLPIPGTRCVGTVQSLDNDKEWDDICVAWHWIEGEILPTITDLARAKKLMERYPNFKFGGE